MCIIPPQSGYGCYPHLHLYRCMASMKASTGMPWIIVQCLRRWMPQLCSNLGNMRPHVKFMSAYGNFEYFETCELAAFSRVSKSMVSLHAKCATGHLDAHFSVIRGQSDMNEMTMRPGRREHVTADTTCVVRFIPHLKRQDSLANFDAQRLEC